MTLQEFRERFMLFVTEHPENTIQARYALRPELAGTPYFDAPLVGCAAADDPLFTLYKTDPKVLGPLFRTPKEWMPESVSVLTFFFPYTQEIRDSNRPDPVVPSDEWLHARVEGHKFMMSACREAAEWLRNEGYRAIVPVDSPDFETSRKPERLALGEPAYTSSWSERHAAYAAGLGTFGLSKHIITEKGVCGRICSIITDAPLEVTPRPYTDPYEYCTFCGACGVRCPVNSIDVEKGKDVITCSLFSKKSKELYKPRSGCGKCQQNVPCESGIPGRNS